MTLSRERSTVTFEPNYPTLLCGHIGRVRENIPSSKNTNVIVGLISLHVEESAALEWLLGGQALNSGSSPTM